MGKVTSTIGIPIKLLNEAQVSRNQSPPSFRPDVAGQGHVVTLEITSGQVYRGYLLEGTIFVVSPACFPCAGDTDVSVAEDNMNVQLKDITVTARDGRVSHLDQVYIRGSHIRFIIVPDMLRNAPMFRNKGQRGRGVGLARGRATVNRARAGRR